MFGAVSSLDERIRGYMAKQAEEQLAARRKAVMTDMTSQLKSNPADVARKVGARYGVSEAGLQDLEGVLLGRPGASSQEVFAPGPQVLLQETADRAATQNPLYQLQQMLSGTKAQDRAGQVAFYGGAAAGGAAGLTAAGQGLMALMQYIQDGLAAQDERKEPLA